MKAWLEGIAGPEFAPALMWTVIALIALLVLLVVVRIVRGLTFGTFVAGGRSRKARLAVMDATAVDSQRRLVLVRRDDIEHLILVGGPTDVVVEQNIRLLPPARRAVAEDHEAIQAPTQPAPAPVPAPVQVQPAARPAPRPAQPAPRPQYAPQVPPPPAPQVAAEPRFSSIAASPQAPVNASVDPATPVRTLRPVAPDAPPPVAAAASYGSSSAYAPPAAAPQQPTRPSLDDELLQELQVTLDIDDNAPAAERKDSRESSLDEEMSKLLGELSVQKP